MGFRAFRTAFIAIVVLVGCVVPAGASAATLAIPDWSGPCRITEHQAVACHGWDRTHIALSNATAIAVSQVRTCAVLPGNAVRCRTRYEDGTNKPDDTRWTTGPPSVDITAGKTHACSIRTDHQVSCWGSNYAGQLGDGTTAPKGPVLVTGLSGVIAIDAGLEHTCAILSTHRVSCWGAGTKGQLGNTGKTTRTTPVAVSGISTAIAISAGDGHSCAILQGGSVECWGDNAAGQIGDGTTTPRPHAVPVAGLTDAVQIAAGAAHTCALRATGAVVCWGDGSKGQLGVAGVTSSLTPIDVPGITGGTPSELVANGDETCVRLPGDNITCWGTGAFGDVRSTPLATTTRPTPTPLTLDRITNVTPPRVMGALRLGNRVSCDPGSWRGERTADDVRDYDYLKRLFIQTGRITFWKAWSPPSPVSGPKQAVYTAVAAPSDEPTLEVTQDHLDHGLSCKVAADNGDDRVAAESALATPTTAPVRQPTIARGLTHACAVLPTHRVSCWGSNFYGELGRGTSGGSATPVSVADLAGAVAVAVGERHSCALKDDGTVACWGFNLYGELGNGAANVGINAYRAVPVTGLSDAISITVGSRHTCAVRATGGVVCWGYGASGRLGNGGTSDSPVPVPVSGIADAIQIAAGDRHTCAVRATGGVVCWGAGANGRLGNNSTANALAPVTVANLPGAIAVAAGSAHTCALRWYGTVRCWGANAHGQIGDGTTTDRHSAVEIGTSPASAPYPALASQLSAGGDTSCVANGGSRTACWGAGAGGALGTGDTADQPIVVDVPGAAEATHVTTGAGGSCVREDDGSAKCWGSGDLLPTTVPGLAVATS